MRSTARLTTAVVGALALSVSSLTVGTTIAGAATAGTTALGVPTAATVSEPRAGVIDETLATALEDALTPVQVIVTFNGDGPPSSADLALLNVVGVTQGITLRQLPIAGVLATSEQVRTLAADPSVRSLHLNEELAYDNNEYTALTGVDRVRTDPKLTKSNGGLPVDGSDVGVLVNDSGVDGTHADLRFGQNLKQNVLGATNLNALEPTLLPITYVEDVVNTDATGGHGTHVAGIVGATGAASGGKYEGVAPGADLVSYGSGAGLLLLDVLGGFDYALTNQRRYGLRVITNSWGTTSDRCTDVDPSDPVNVATKEAFDRNIVVVFSAGNSGPDECTITGNYKKAPWVIAVAAGDRDRELTDFSSRGKAGNGGSFELDGKRWTWQDRPTLTAPGHQVVSTRAPSPIGVVGTPIDVERIDPAHIPFYTTLSGTSMAAPHVAGVVALMLDRKPTLNPLQVKSTLTATATDMPGYETWEAGDGYVDAYAAVVRVGKSAEQSG